MELTPLQQKLQGTIFNVGKDKSICHFVDFIGATAPFNCYIVTRYTAESIQNKFDNGEWIIIEPTPQIHELWT